MQNAVNLVNQFVLFYPQSLLIFGQKRVFTLIFGVLHFKQFYGFFVLFCANVSEAESTFVLIHIRICMFVKGLSYCD